MEAVIDIHPKKSWGRDEIDSLPYEADRVVLDCLHSLLYLVRVDEDGPLQCGLCFFREGYKAELPTSFHLYKTLAENGNPESSPKFLSHLTLVMGLKMPLPGQDLKEFRRSRTSLAREQYRVRGPRQFGSQISVHSKRVKFSQPSRLFPIASALWKLMGYQPPLGIVLVLAVGGRTELEIATKLEVSRMNVHIRMAKAIRTTLGYLPNEREERAATDHTTGEADQSDQAPDGSN